MLVIFSVAMSTKRWSSSVQLCLIADQKAVMNLLSTMAFWMPSSTYDESIIKLLPWMKQWMHTFIFNYVRLKVPYLICLYSETFWYYQLTAKSVTSTFLMNNGRRDPLIWFCVWWCCSRIYCNIGVTYSFEVIQSSPSKLNVFRIFYHIKEKLFNYESCNECPLQTAVSTDCRGVPIGDSFKTLKYHSHWDRTQWQRKTETT